MKKLIVLMTLLASSHSFAGQACSASYAAGIGHVFKGVTSELGENQRIREGQTSQDSLYTVRVTDGKPSLYETKSGAQVKLVGKEIAPEMQMYATQSLNLYPSGVPGTDAEHRFIIILCADENSF